MSCSAWREKAGLLRLWRLTDVTLLTSRYAFEEARRNLETQEQRKRLTQLMVNVDLVSDFAYGDLPLDVVLPEKDRPMLLPLSEPMRHTFNW